MLEDLNCSTRVMSLFQAIFKYSTLNKYANVFLYLIQYLQIVGLILARNKFQRMESWINDGNLELELIWVIFGVNVILLGMIGAILVWQGKSDRNGQTQPLEEGLWMRIIKRSLAVQLIVYRRVLAIPILLILLLSISSPQPLLFSISTLTLLLTLALYLLSLIPYLNTIPITPQTLSYPFFLNLESTLSFYLPIQCTMVTLDCNVLPLTLLAMLVCGVVLLLRPVVSYANGEMSAWVCAMMVGMVMGDGWAMVLGMEQGWVMVLGCGVVGVVVREVIKYRLKAVLMFSQVAQDRSNIWGCLINAINSLSYHQVLFYHLLNYSTKAQDLVLWTLKLKQQHLSQKNQLTLSNHQTPHMLSTQQTSVNQIIQVLRHKPTHHPQVKSMLHELILMIMQQKYDPSLFREETLSSTQTRKSLLSSSHLFSIVIMLQLHSCRVPLLRCYTSLRAYQRLEPGFLASLKNGIMMEQVQQKLAREKEYSLKLERYFRFQRKRDNFNEAIGKVVGAREKLWWEAMGKAVDGQLLTEYIKESYRRERIVERACYQLNAQFENDYSPLVLYDLISSYSHLILNKPLSSSTNQFYFLVKSYREQLQKFRNQGGDRIDSDNKIPSINTNQQKKYSILENIGTCLVSLQPKSKGVIEWANDKFWNGFYSHKEDDKKSQFSEKCHISDMLWRELRQVHDCYLDDWTEKQKKTHPQSIFLYDQKKNILSSVWIHLQLYPCLVRGLKVCCSFCDVEENTQFSKNEKFWLLVKNNWEVAGWSEGFEKWRELLHEGGSHSQNGSGFELLAELRVQIQAMAEKMNSEPIIQKQSPPRPQKQPNQRRKPKSTIKQKKSPPLAKTPVSTHHLPQTKQSSLTESPKISLANVADAPNFNPKQNSQSNSSAGQKKTLEVEIDGSRFCISLTKQYNMEPKGSVFSYTALLVQFECLDGQEQPKDLNAVEQQLMQMKSHFSYNNSSINSCNIMQTVRGSSSDGQWQDQILEEPSKKSQKVIQIQKSYKSLTCTQTPRRIKLWLLSILVLMLIFFCCLPTNLFLFSLRHQTYTQTKLQVKYFNELITDISQLVIALRQYNFYAYMYGPQDPHIPLLIDQVNTEEGQVEFKLNNVARYLNEKWQAIEVAKDGGQRMVQEEDYVVIASFMLSSMTYISQVNPQEMSFPIFWSSYPNQTQLTPTQINFNEAVYNGIYVVLQNLNNRKQAFLLQILSGINDWTSKVYIYPCVIGFMVLIIFAIVSLRVEKTSDMIQEKSFGLLSQITEKVKMEKLDNVRKFREMNDFRYDKSEQQVRSHASSVLASMEMSSKPRHSSVLGSPDKKFTNPEASGQTRRHITADCSMSNQFQVLKGQSSTRTQQEEHQPQKISLSKSCSSRYAKCIYFLVSLPSILYCAIMLLDGIQTDNTMVKGFAMGSEIYMKKSNLELVYLLTRETFYHEEFIGHEGGALSNRLKQLIASVYEHDRKLQRMIQEHQQAIWLQKLMSQISHHSICSLLASFPLSPYHSITFSAEQCHNLSNGILLTGSKQSQVSYLQTSLYLLSTVPNPELLDQQQRLEHISGPELKTMKQILAYCEVLMDMMDDALERDLDAVVEGSLRLGVGYLFIGLVGLGLVAVAVRYRLRAIIGRKKFVASVVGITSLRTIKTHHRLSQIFLNIGLGFYE